MSDENNYLLVLSTCPDSGSAKKMAQALVTDKLAACVNIVPGVQSVFSWQGELDTVDEQMLLIKTTLARYADLEKQLKSLHPYELPEIIAVPIHTGLTGYLDWISTNTEGL